MASDPVAAWEALSLEESGGAGGVRRSARIERFSLDADGAARIGALLKAIHARSAAVGPNGTQPAPDRPTLTLRLQSFHGNWEATFDGADLPAEVAQLAQQFPPRRPPSERPQR